MAFDIGAALLGVSSSEVGAVTGSPSDSVMRPARGLKLVVGIVVDFVAPPGGPSVHTREVKYYWLIMFDWVIRGGGRVIYR